MDQLWEIALKATTKSVSTEAIHILNNYYINHTGRDDSMHDQSQFQLLDKEAEFVKRCMDNIMSALNSLSKVHLCSLLFIFFYISIPDLMMGCKEKFVLY